MRREETVRGREEVMIEGEGEGGEIGCESDDKDWNQSEMPAVVRGAVDSGSPAFQPVN